MKKQSLDTGLQNTRTAVVSLRIFLDFVYYLYNAIRRGNRLRIRATYIFTWKYYVKYLDVKTKCCYYKKNACCTSEYCYKNLFYNKTKGSKDTAFLLSSSFSCNFFLFFCRLNLLLNLLSGHIKILYSLHYIVYYSILLYYRTHSIVFLLI